MNSACQVSSLLTWAEYYSMVEQPSSLLQAFSSSYPSLPLPTTFFFFLIACKFQGCAVGSGWNQLSVYRVYPRKSPWVIVMAILITLAVQGNLRVPPTLQPQSLLGTNRACLPLLGSYMWKKKKKKKELSKFQLLKTLDKKLLSKTSSGVRKRLQTLGESLMQLDK